MESHPPPRQKKNPLPSTGKKKDNVVILWKKKMTSVDKKIQEILNVQNYLSNICSKDFNVSNLLVELEEYLLFLKSNNINEFPIKSDIKIDKLPLSMNDFRVQAELNNVKSFEDIKKLAENHNIDPDEALQEINKMHQIHELVKDNIVWKMIISKIRQRLLSLFPDGGYSDEDKMKAISFILDTFEFPPDFLKPSDDWRIKLFELI